MDLAFTDLLRPPNGVHSGSIDPAAPPPDLYAVLDRAAQASKLLSSPSSSSTPATAAAVAALRNAHRMIGAFLAEIDPGDNDGDEPMADLRGEGEEDVVGPPIVDELEEGMRECALQGKRRKRRVSPSCPVGRASGRREEALPSPSTDGSRSAIDLIFQFHA